MSSTSSAVALPVAFITSTRISSALCGPTHGRANHRSAPKDLRRANRIGRCHEFAADDYDVCVRHFAACYRSSTPPRTASQVQRTAPPTLSSTRRQPQMAYFGNCFTC